MLMYSHGIVSRRLDTLLHKESLQFVPIGGIAMGSKIALRDDYANSAVP